MRFKIIFLVKKCVLEFFSYFCNLNNKRIISALYEEEKEIKVIDKRVLGYVFTTSIFSDAEELVRILVSRCKKLDTEG